MNYQTIIDIFLPNQYEIRLDWENKEEDDVIGIFVKYPDGRQDAYPSWIIYKFDISPISATNQPRRLYKYGLLQLEPCGDYVTVGPDFQNLERDAFIETIKYLVEFKLNQLYEDESVDQ